MNYFLVYKEIDDDRLKIRAFNSRGDVIEHVMKNFINEVDEKYHPEFVDNLELISGRKMCIIKGEIVLPKKVEVVTKYVIED